jgi:phage shock protein PspC (stress-responsive transcriptional regulator)
MVRRPCFPHDDAMPVPPQPPPPPAPPVPPAPPSDFTRAMKRLRRSRRDRMLGGVAGGIAQTYGWDPTLVRLAWVVAAVFGIGIPAYIVLWIVVPPDGPGAEFDRERDHGAMLALVLLGIGVVWLASMLWPDRPHFFNIGWPLALVAGGIAVLLFRAREDDDPFFDEDPTSSTVTAPFVEREPDSESETEAPTVETPTADTTASAWTQTEDWPGGRRSRGWHRHWDGDWHDEWHRRRRNRPKPFLGPLVFSILLIGAGVAALIEMLDIADVDPEVIGALGLGVIGSALVVSAWYGRARGLIALGILLTIPLSVLSMIDVPLEGGFGDRTYRPDDIAEVKDEYRLTAGQMTLDLRSVNFREGTHEIEATVGMGELVVQVPDDVSLAVDARSGAGVVKLFGEEDEGWDAEASRVVREPGGARLVLDLEVGMGEVNVARYTDEDIETLVEENTR